MIGQTVGNYRIIEQIGLGGMATIYKAYDPDTDRYVALKILPQQFSHDPQFRQRFQREAKAIAKLEHIHILPIFAYGEDNGIAYMAMRYLQTGTLTDRIAAGPLSFAEASRILNQLAGALDHAHANGILHRDMKPSNVLLDEAGNAYLMDFGIAKIVEATIDLTGDRLLGTPAYMSPEQCKGETVTAASDIYSLGIILYEIVTGRRPFHAETPVAVILQQLNDPLPPPRDLRPDLPPAAENVIFKALAKEPDSRYQSAREMADAFAQAIAEADTAVTSPLPAPPPTPQTEPIAPPVSPPPPLRRLPGWAWGLAGVAAAAILMTLGVLLGNARSESDSAAAGAATMETAEAEETPAPTAVISAQPEGGETEPPAVPLASDTGRCNPGETLLFFDDFADGDLAGWGVFDGGGNPAAAGWEVVRDGDNFVLAGSGHNWAVPQNVFGENVILRLKIRAGLDSDFHVNVRLGEGRYYAGPGYLQRDPLDFLLAEWPFEADDRWHEMALQVDGSHVQLFWDSALVAEVEDSYLVPGGEIGLESTGGTTWYDDVLLCALPETTDIRFVDSGQTVGESGASKSALGDLNGDGTLDVFIAGNAAMAVWLNDGRARFTAGSQNQTEGQGWSNQAALGDLDGDGDLDALAGVAWEENGGENIIWFNDGGGNFTEGDQRLGGSHSWSVALGDLDGDGDLDIFDANGGPSLVWLNEGDGRFTDSNQALGGGDSVQIALGDLDGDGDLDAFVVNFDGGEPNQVFLNEGNGRFQQTGQELGQSASIGAALGDLDGDGDLDAFVANGDNGREPNKVWLNDGNGRFTDSGQLLGDGDSWAVALGDLDGDGDLDAFVGNGPNLGGQANTIWLNDGSGQFTDSGLRLGNGLTRYVSLGDLDGDGDLDAFISNEGGNRVWLNETGEGETAVSPQTINEFTE